MKEHLTWIRIIIRFTHVPPSIVCISLNFRWISWFDLYIIPRSFVFLLYLFYHLACYKVALKFYNWIVCVISPFYNLWFIQAGGKEVENSSQQLSKALIVNDRVCRAPPCGRSEAGERVRVQPCSRHHYRKDVLVKSVHTCSRRLWSQKRSSWSHIIEAVGDDVCLWLRVFPPVTHTVSSVRVWGRKKNADTLFVMLSSVRLARKWASIWM